MTLPPSDPLADLTDEEITQALADLDADLLARSPADFAQVLSRGDAEPWLPYAHLRLLNEKLMRLVRGEGTGRLVVTMPPRHGKSLLCSLYFPAWFLNQNPDKRVILCSYGDDFAATWGRKVRDLIQSHEATLNIRVNMQSKAADRWDVDGRKGGMKTAGVGGQITGLGANLLIIDDPVKNAEEADSAVDREKKWDWWRSAAHTRLEPNAIVVVIQCMTGDTLVTMRNGGQKPLSEIRPGDYVATYEDGCITSAEVKNWANQGPDRVFAIRMKSGTVVKANARHPFLTVEDGETRWTRTRDLSAGSVILRAHGQESFALPKDATCQPAARECVPPTTTRHDGRQASDLRVSTLAPAEKPISGTVTALTSLNTNGCSQNKVGSAPSVGKAKVQITGEASSASITAMTAMKYAASSATTATSLLDTPELPKFSSPPLSTYSVTRDTVLEVVEVGVEDVYDIQVDRTENFIANGLVSHNTRWHEDDLTGRILKDNPEEWEIINLPALAEDGDPLGRVPGAALCPERYDEEALAAIHTAVGQRVFAALYQQRPTPEGGGFFKKDDLRYWRRNESDEGFTYLLEDPVEGTLIVPQAECWRFITMDLAVTARTTSDYTVAAVWDVAAYLEPSRLILRHVERIRVEGSEHEQMVRDLWATWKPSFIGIEEAVHGSLVLSQARRDGILVRPLKHKSKDKLFRAKEAALLTENHRVFIPKKAPWVADWEHELLIFPSGTHDDQVDTFAYAAHEILRGMNLNPKKPEPWQPPSMEDRIARQIRDRDRGPKYHPMLGRL